MARGESTISTMTGTCATNAQRPDSSNWPVASRPQMPRNSVQPARPARRPSCTSVSAAEANQPALSVFRR